MNSKQRTLLFAALGFFVVTGAVFLGSKADADLPREQIAGGEWDAAEDDGWARGMMRRAAAKVALGNNANAMLSLDLIEDGGAGNRRDDGVTAGTVSGRGATIALEVFATGVATSLRGAVLRFRFDASLVSFVKAENSAFGLSIPEGSVGVNLASTSSVALGASGFLARAEFRTVADVAGREFSIGVERVTVAESGTSSDALTTTRVIRFNATPSADFDDDGTVGFSDFLAFAGSFGASRGDARYEARFDLDGDGSVGFSDFLVFAGAFGSQVPPSGGGGGGATVTIADANLRAVIADNLGKAHNASITRSEMATLTSLEARNKGIRNLTGLKHASNLTTLRLGRVRVDGEVVNSNHISDLSSISNLTNLTFLSLGSNRVSSVSALSNLNDLTELHLGDNQTISDISVLSNLTELTRLNLWDNSISDISALANLTNLTFLSLSGNRISSISALSNLTDLTSLGLSGTGISDISSLSNLTELTTLFLGRRRGVDGEWEHNDISSLSPLSRLTNLTYLGLTGNRISSVSALSKLTNLTQLHLGGNSGLSDIAALSNLAMLTRLNLWGNSISDISALSRLTDLSYLGLSTNSISDILPLVANTGLGDGDTVNLKSNPLSSVSINTHVPALQGRGVSVEFDRGTGGGGGGSPDLVVGSPSVDDNTLTAGQSFTLSTTVRNQGNAPAAATTLRYYRSSNATISTVDTEVGTDAVSGLSAGAASAESIGLNAPSDAGRYYYGACVDNFSGESNTDNNCSSGVSVTVSDGNTGGGNNLGACAVGMVVKPNQRCSVGSAEFINIGGGCYQFTAFGTGRFCSSGFNLNGLRGTRSGNDYRITAVP